VSTPRLGRAPAVLVVPACLGAALLVVPLVTLVLDTPWASLPAQLRSEAVGEALAITAVTSVLTVAACLLLGTPLAWLLARVEFRGRQVVRALVLVPLVLPPVVAGVALVTALGRSGLIGQHLPFSVPYTTAGVVVAHTFVSLPFFVLAVEGALRSGGGRYDVVAATLGADRWTTFRRVTLPLVLPGIAAGSALAWARSLGEFGATITFAGNYPGTTQTMPSLIYVALNTDPTVARTLSLVLLVVSVGVLVLLRERWAVSQ
jgi:molybdate transport system permease protein